MPVELARLINMLIFGFEFITGFMIGVELVDLGEIYENVEGWSFVVDLGILRLVVEKRTQ